MLLLLASCAAAPSVPDSPDSPDAPDAPPARIEPPAATAAPVATASTAEGAAPWSTSLDDLEPAFRARLTRVLEGLVRRGYTPSVGTTWRDPRVQDAIYALGKSTNAAGGQSCHNAVDAAGRPAARAADVWRAPLDLPLVLGLPDRLAHEAPFLRALGALAKEEGLRWGGAWRGRTSAWGAHDLGWDPAHVEWGRCASSLAPAPPTR